MTEPRVERPQDGPADSPAGTPAASSPTTVTALTALAWLVALTALTWLQIYRWQDPTLPGMSWQEPHQLGDFRDTIWVPGQYLLSGGNPYDTPSYVAAHPWAQEFNLYAPVWLVLSVGLSLLPFSVATAVYLALGAAGAAGFLWVTLRLVAPHWVRFGVPLGLVWFALWSPSRYALQNGGTWLVLLGCVLVLDGLTRPAPADRRRIAVGVALALIKPQFGVPLLVFALAAGRRDAVWRGVVGLAVASLPAGVACVVAAGGIGEFVDGVRANLAYSSSPDSPTGLASPFNGRIDVLGMAARLGAVDQPGWAALAVLVVSLAVGAFVVRRAGSPLAVIGAAAALTLLAVVHQPYDVVILVLPAVLGLAGAVAQRSSTGRLRPPRAEVLAWVAAAVPVLHLHGLSVRLVPGLGRLGADLIDVAALLLAVLAGLVACRRAGSPQDRRLREPERPA